MYGLRRRHIKSRAELLRDEVGAGFDHLLRAGRYAAEGVGASVGPRIEAARGQLGPAAGRVATQAAGRARDAASYSWGATTGALAPLTSAVNGRRAGGWAARRADRVARRVRSTTPIAMRRKRGRQMARKRGFMLAGLLAAGLALGAAGALVARRRQQRWDEYEPGRVTEPMAGQPPIGEPAHPGGAMPGTSRG